MSLQELLDEIKRLKEKEPMKPYISAKLQGIEETVEAVDKHTPVIRIMYGGEDIWRQIKEELK